MPPQIDHFATSGSTYFLRLHDNTCQNVVFLIFQPPFWTDLPRCTFPQEEALQYPQEFSMQFNGCNSNWSIAKIRIFFTEPVIYSANSIAVILTASIRHSLMLHWKNSSLVFSSESSLHVCGSHVIDEMIFRVYQFNCSTDATPFVTKTWFSSIL